MYYLLYIVVFTENLKGTEWHFMCRCAVKKLLTHSLTVRCIVQPHHSENRTAEISSSGIATGSVVT